MLIEAKIVRSQPLGDSKKYVPAWRGDLKIEQAESCIGLHRQIEGHSKESILGDL
jgi:hypothetical protein